MREGDASALFASPAETFYCETKTLKFLFKCEGLTFKSEDFQTSVIKTNESGLGDILRLAKKKQDSDGDANSLWKNKTTRPLTLGEFIARLMDLK